MHFKKIQQRNGRRVWLDITFLSRGISQGRSDRPAMHAMEPLLWGFFGSHLALILQLASSYCFDFLLIWKLYPSLIARTLLVMFTA